MPLNIPSFSFDNLVKHPVSVMLLILISAVSGTFFLLNNSWKDRLADKEKENIELRRGKAISDSLVIQLYKEKSELYLQFTTQRTLNSKKDSLLDTKILKPLTQKK